MMSVVRPAGFFISTWVSDSLLKRESRLRELQGNRFTRIPDSQTAKSTMRANGGFGLAES
jgi:hypothetical protein